MDDDGKKDNGPVVMDGQITFDGGQTWHEATATFDVKGEPDSAEPRTSGSRVGFSREYAAGWGRTFGKRDVN